MFTFLFLVFLYLSFSSFTYFCSLNGFVMSNNPYLSHSRCSSSFLSERSYLSSLHPEDLSMRWVWLLRSARAMTALDCIGLCTDLPTQTQWCGWSCRMLSGTVFTGNKRRAWWNNPVWKALGFSSAPDFALLSGWLMTNNSTSKSRPQSGCITYFWHCHHLLTDALCR